MNLSDFLDSYEELVQAADLAFAEMAGAHPELVRCDRGCDDCCHAVFGLFLVEAACLHEAFLELGEPVRREVLERCSAADEAAERLEAKLRECRHDPDESARVMAVERIPCPLLTDASDCRLYDARPLTCRIYGIPALIRGAIRVCGKSGFSGNGRFGAFNMDMAQQRLLDLSTAMLEDIEDADPEKASLLVSVSKALRSSVYEIIDENYLKDP